MSESGKQNAAEPPDDGGEKKDAPVESAVSSRVDGGGDQAVRSRLGPLDALMNENALYARFIPFLAYLLLLMITGFVAEKWAWAYPFLYVLQCGVVVWMLWRYRKLLPELTLSFDWLAVPVGLGVAYAWIWLGMVVEESAQVRHEGIGEFTANLNEFISDPHGVGALTGPEGEAFYFIDYGNSTQRMFEQIKDASPALFWLAFGLRLVGMSLIVPLFEELFIRSLILRSMSSARQTWTGFLQLMADFPVIGDWVMNTQAGRKADDQPAMFTKQFNETPLGKLTLFGVIASTLVFAVNHVPRDYLGCVMCGVAYCLLLAVTRKKGLGPVCWAHGITNAVLWWYTMHTDDWRFL